MIEVITVDTEEAKLIEVVVEEHVAVMFATLAVERVISVEIGRGNMKVVTTMARHGILNLPVLTKRTWLLECNEKASGVDFFLHM